MSAEVLVVKIKMFLLDAEEKASETYAPLLAELWRIIREQEKADADHLTGDPRAKANGHDAG